MYVCIVYVYIIGIYILVSYLINSTLCTMILYKPYKFRLPIYPE